ncbi:unnamed protein product [Soboliphyme baturini]|uniref:Transposase n=1 Tax=Soboliphyme baturini TaxID=241478 RepID=A0A183J6Y5_9BILA|nr:unnamed protein product [Soboliphyme baturini]
MYCVKSTLSVIKSIFIPLPTYGQEWWMMTEKLRTQVQAAEGSFLRQVARLRRLNIVRNIDILKSLGIQLLLLQIEKSQLRCFGHFLRMPPERKGTCQTDRQKAHGTAQFILVKIYRWSLFHTPVIFWQNSESGAGSVSLEALSDASAFAFRKEKRPWKMKIDLPLLGIVVEYKPFAAGHEFLAWEVRGGRHE